MIKTLNNGNTIPIVGLGTWQSKNDECFFAVQNALACGYTHIDSAHIYNNHEQVAKAIKAKNVDRSKLFITSKLPPAKQGYEQAIKCFEESLKQLGTDYLDLFLIHWPGVSHTKPESPKNATKRKESWLALEYLYKSGKVKNIGVSNYYVNHLEELLTYCTIVPQINQIEFHPWLFKQDVLQFCNKHNIVLEAYSPLGLGQLIQDPAVLAIAAKYGPTVTSAQVLLNWSVQHGCVVLPKSVNAPRILENYLAVENPTFTLSEQDMQALNAMNKNHHVCWNPETVK